MQMAHLACAQRGRVRVKTSSISKLYANVTLMSKTTVISPVEISESSATDVAKCAIYYNMSENESEHYRYSTGETLLLTILLPFILICGVLGNVLFVYVAVKIPHMRTVTNRYLVSLSVADVLFLTSAIGHKVWKYANSPLKSDDSPLGAFGCVWIYFLSDTAYFASLMFVTLVSIDRYVAVCRPQVRQSIIKGKSLEMIAFCWLMSGILSALLTPGNLEQGVFCLKWPKLEKYNSWPDTIRFCLPLKHFRWISSFSTGLQTIPFFITLVLNIGLYVAIIRGLDECIRRMKEHGVQKNKDAGMRNQIAKMLVVNGVVFFCFLAPFEIYSLFSMVAILRTQNDEPIYLLKNENARSYILLVSQLLSYVNSAINPIIYTVMCRRYKQAFKEALVPTSCFRNGYDKGISMESCRTGQSRLETSATEKKDTNI